MKSVLTILAGSGWGARCAFVFAGLGAYAVQALPVEVGAEHVRMASPLPIPADGSALTRPLFDPGRRPWTAQGSRDLILRPDPVKPVLVLRGIRLDGGKARAFIDDGSGDQTWLALGDGRSDWRITAIGPDRVSISQRGRIFEAEFLGHPATLRPIPFADASPDLRP